MLILPQNLVPYKPNCRALNLLSDLGGGIPLGVPNQENLDYLFPGRFVPLVAMSTHLEYPEDLTVELLVISQQ